MNSPLAANCLLETWSDFEQRNPDKARATDARFLADATVSELFHELLDAHDSHKDLVVRLEILGRISRRRVDMRDGEMGREHPDAEQVDGIRPMFV